METLSDIFAGLDNDLSDECLPAAPKHTHDDVSAPLPRDAAGNLKFMLAGKATVTLVSRKTDARFTYRITASQDGLAHFVGVLTGSDNESSYSYLGRISRGIFWQGRKVPKAGDVSASAPSAKAFDWAWRSLAKGILPESLEVWHAGKCGRCSRKLTVPSSIAQGYGPECVGKI
jgi:hypothetical protein